MNKNIRVELPAEAIGNMIKDAMSKKEFREYLVGALEKSYKLDLIMNAITNGVPKPKFAVGIEVYCNRLIKSNVEDDKGNFVEIEVEAGKCIIKAFDPLDVYSEYTLTTNIVNGKGDVVETTTWCRESDLRLI